MSDIQKIRASISSVKIDPKTAFGNVELIKKIRNAEEQIEFLERTEPCPGCNATGLIDHRCDCYKCEGGPSECDVCYGLGRIDKRK